MLFPWCPALAQTVLPAGFGQMSVTQPSRGTAVLTGQLLSTGGQNPTVKIRWGDEDRGTEVTPSTAWDNEVTVSTNQAVGTFSTTITIPNLEKVYYFRAIASNAGGSVVSRQLGVLVPSAPVGVANLQGRWNFDSANAKDSSGAGRDGTAKKLFSPSELTNLKLWLDASDTSTITHSSNAVSKWADKSGNEYNATQSTADRQPMVATNSIGGKTAILFDGSDSMGASTRLGLGANPALTVFVVCNILTDNNTDDRIFHIGGSSHSLSVGAGSQGWSWRYDGGNELYGSVSHGTDYVLAYTRPSAGNYASAKLFINGTEQTRASGGNDTGSPTSTDANFKIGSNYNGGWNFINGYIGEIIVIESDSNSDRYGIEGYLAHKWGLTSNLSSSHSYALGAPVSASGSPSYITDTPFGSGKAIDLADGHVEVVTGGTEDVFDGGSAFSVSAWVKGWPSDDLAPFVSKGAVIKTPKDVASLKLWLSSTDLSTMDKSSTLGGSGPPSADGDAVKYWGDKSGNDHHAIVDSGTPTFNPAGLHGKYPSINTSGDVFAIDGSATAFDGWDSMTIIYASQLNETDNWRWPLLKANCFNLGKTNVAGVSLRSYRSDGTYLDHAGGSNAWPNPLPKIITMRYDGASTSSKFYANGAFTTQNTSALASFTSDTSQAFKINRKVNWGDILIYRDALSDADREIAEGYLAHKFGMVEDLPTSHSGRLEGWALGTGIAGNDVSSTLSNVGNMVSGSTSTISPTTDSQWHHVVSTFDGENRKLFIDTVEVSSINAPGVVTPTVASLVFGAVDLNTTTPTGDTIKNVSAGQHSGIKLDEVRFYDSALSSDEISEIYNFGKGDLNKVGGFSTLPSVINATAGTALSTTITADFPNAVYSAYNLPDGLSFTGGLSINSATGEISGTPTVGGTHIITVVAEGGTNDAPKKTSTTIVYSAGTSGPKWGSSEATNIVGDSALLLAEIEQSGAESNTVDFVWDTVNRNSIIVSDWNSSALNVGTGKEGFYGKQLNNLTPGQTYYYRAKTRINQNPLDLISNDMSLWLDAASLTTAENTWSDLSGNNNHATKNGSTTVITGAQNGKSVMRYSGAGTDYHEWNDFNNIRTVFWVIRADSDNNGFILGDDGEAHFHNNLGNPLTFWSDSWSSANVRNGNLAVNGTRNINGTTAGMNTSLSNLSVVSLKTAGNVEASRFCRDRGNGSRNWKGDLGELIICDTELSDSDIQKVEGYLAHKWGLASALPSSGHSYKTNPPQSAFWGPIKSFTTPTNTTAPTLGNQSTANLDTTSADMQVILTDNGNAATTVVFYWGDNDGDTTASNWDSNVTLTNAPEGTNLRASLTGLTSGTTYYFRTWATNTANKGDDWGDSTTAFTTVTSSVREETDAIRYSDLEGWWKLDGNLLDSSGNNRHGDLSTNPAKNAVAWFDASSAGTITHSSNAVSQWADKSGRGNHATQSTASAKPTYSATDKKLTFDGGDIMQVTNDPFNGLQEPGVFAVVKWNNLSNWNNVIASFHGESKYRLATSSKKQF
jgi:hypothetical protein